MFNSDISAGVPNQQSKMKKDWRTKKFCSSFSFRAELHSLVATELRNIDSFASKGARMKGAGKTLTEVVDPCFLEADAGVKNAFSVTLRRR